MNNVDTAAESMQPKRLRRIIALGIPIALVVFVIAWIQCGVLLAHITVGSARLDAHSSDAAIASLLQKQAANYRLTIAYPDGRDKKFTLGQLGLQLDTSASIQATRAQQHQLRHRLAWWHPLSAVMVLREDVDALNNFVANDVNLTKQPSKDARLTIIRGKITLSGAITGVQYGLKNPKPSLLSTARTLSTRAVKLQVLQVNPALTTALLAPYKSLLARTIDQSATFTVGGQTIHPSPAQIASWLDIQPNDKTKKLDVTVNSGKVAAYISDIAAAAIRPPRDQVNIQLANGSSKVLVPGVNGVSVVNQSGVATNLAKNLLSGEGFNISLPVGSASFKVITAGDYPKWIEVDLTNKVLYAYQHATLVKTFLVSAGAPATPTVTGQYHIYAKYVQQNMSGLNVDGTSYFQPNVPWVNYFYSDFAIHGNYWRPISYFGHVNSSHGCVGLLDDNAEWVYNWAPIGTPVIIHT